MIAWTRIVPVVLAAALTASSGLIADMLRERGGEAALLEAGRRLQQLPGDFGRWRLMAEKPLSDSAVRELQCRGYVNRSYLHLGSGAQVNVAVLVGPTGPMAAHTPEICYSSREYDLAAPPSQRLLRPQRGGADEFRCVRFHSRRLTSPELSVYYAWNDGERWRAPTAPRLALSLCPKLYKIQTAAYLTGDEKENPCEAFLRDFLPLLDQQIARRAQG